MRIWVCLLVAMSGALACGRAPAPPPDAPVSTRIGWIASGCLAIANNSIGDGTPVTVVVLDDDKKTTIVNVQVSGRGTPDRKCPVRPAAASADEALRFYVLSNPIAVGIGIVGPVRRTGDSIDVNGDDRADQFTRCAASEGISFAVWSNGRYAGEPFWSGYEYLGYDIESDCPS